MASRRDERKRRTRETILRAAQGLFSERGLAATSTELVAVAAGVSHGSIFQHFPRREQLLSAVVDRFARELRGGLERPGDSSLGELLEGQLRALAAVAPFYARLLDEAATLPAPARQSLRDIEGALGAPLLLALSAARLRGEIRETRDPRWIVRSWIATLHHALRRMRFAGSPRVFLAEGLDLIEHTLALLRP